MSMQNIGAGSARPVSGWTGWISFASTMLILIGTFHAIEGLVGVLRDGYYEVPVEDLVVEVDYAVWGWLHLGLGLIAIATGLGMMTGQFWARIVGVVFAVVSSVVNLAFVNAVPVWATLIIVFNVLVIWALTVHGGDMKDREAPGIT
jgi:hypothetical protein